MAKQPQELLWVEDLLPEGISRRAMFGGFAYYLDGKMILVCFEEPGTKNYRDHIYDFEVWNGCLFPAEKEFHPQLLKKFPFLRNHPVLPKWLYLPLKTEEFEDLATRVLRHVLAHQDIWGSFPKSKKSKTTKAKAVDVKMDTSRPRMFSDESLSFDLSKAQKISDLKNLGPASERVFAKAGIKTAPQLIKLGWKKAMIKLVESDPKNLHLIMANAVIGALTNKDWFKIDPELRLQAKEFLDEMRKKKKSQKQKTSADKKKIKSGQKVKKPKAKKSVKQSR